MEKYKITPITPENYSKCNNIWDMTKDSKYAQKFLKEIINGTRFAFAYSANDEFLGECAIVIKNDDPDYTIENKRAYLSRLIVKDTMRNQGIGNILVDFIISQAKELGFSELSLGVDKDNLVAIHLYKTKGFTNTIYEGEDNLGAFYKLLKIL